METQKKKTKWNPNPTGKGGFGDHPEHRNPGGRPKNQESVVWWMCFFKNMSVKEFQEWAKKNPIEKRTVAAELARIRVFQASKTLPDFKEVVDRTEGRPVEVSKVDLTSDNKPINFSIVVENGKHNQAS